MAKTVDARGLPCPQPVLLTRDALRESDAVTTIVDSDTARHNVTRMAEKAGYTVRAEEREDGIYLHISRGEAAPAVAPAPAPTPSGGPLVLVVPSEFMGRGEHEELGQILIRGFLHTLNEVSPLPDVLIFFNSGVKLTVEGSPVLEDLRTLQAQGVQILICGTCLGYYGLKEKVAVGEVSNMYTIAETLMQAGRVVSL
ncbi:MAG: sulfurtransferase-like selenium metabolism protein YedF [Thermoflexales bacterium]|nr:sulfurtransferase-like selenium metabolism protein YedF [Thermoflexales bacterium]